MPRPKSENQEMTMKTIVSALLALSVLAGFVAHAAAAEQNSLEVEQQQDWHRNFGL
jgi:hypothetical protein